jgi:type II secretory pathway pseudopilin PulG
VISIIGLLSSMMYASVPGIMNKVKKTRTKNAAIHLRNAINAYFTEYRKFPFHSKPGDITTIRLVTDPELMDVLCASGSEVTNDGLNPREIVFFSD